MATTHAPHATDRPDPGSDVPAHRWRRRTTIAGTAVAGALAVSLPFVLGGDIATSRHGRVGSSRQRQRLRAAT